MTDKVDWRCIERRQGVFMDFYEFHLRYRSHAGAVYYLMPYLRKVLNWSNEQALWYAFINGNTQNPITSYLLHKRFPNPADAPKMVEWYQRNYIKLAFDTDRRYHKKFFSHSTAGYLNMIKGQGQQVFWERAAEQGFKGVWKSAKAIPTFGRLSAFSYSEYLKIMGINFDCDNLMLDDIQGSRSHRNGICIVAGMDKYDWHRSNPAFNGMYSSQLLDKLEIYGAWLLKQMKQRAKGKDWEQDVSYFTLETALCTYKSWHRPNRRYPNVYNDMLYYRIKEAEERWQGEDLRIFWNARSEYLPAHLRLEDMPNDAGLCGLKQNHYLKTGEVIMMDVEYPWYKNGYNDAVRAGTVPQHSR